METIDSFSDIKGLDDLVSFIDRYCLEFMVPDCKFDPVTQEIMDLSQGELVSLTADLAYAKAFKLNAYCICIRKNLDKNIAKVNWAEEILNRIVGTHWRDHSEYMKYEPKRQAIIAEDTFATKVEKMRIYLLAANQQMASKLLNVERMANILQDIGKRKAYDR